MLCKLKQHSFGARVDKVDQWKMKKEPRNRLIHIWSFDPRERQYFRAAGKQSFQQMMLHKIYIHKKKRKGDLYTSYNTQNEFQVSDKISAS